MNESILLSDEECLQRHLDTQPGDTATRLVLADLLEEQGRDDEALAQRFFAAMNLWPDNDLAFNNQIGWHWWNRATGDHSHRAHAEVPEKVQPYMPTGEWLYLTRLEAEAVLVRALRSAGKL